MRRAGLVVARTLDAVVAERCVALEKDRDLIRGQAGFHWWPNRVSPI